MTFAAHSLPRDERVELEEAEASLAKAAGERMDWRRRKNAGQYDAVPGEKRVRGADAKALFAAMHQVVNEAVSDS